MATDLIFTFHVVVRCRGRVLASFVTDKADSLYGWPAIVSSLDTLKCFNLVNHDVMDMAVKIGKNVTNFTSRKGRSLRLGRCRRSSFNREKRGQYRCARFIKYLSYASSRAGRHTAMTSGERRLVESLQESRFPTKS